MTQRLQTGARTRRAKQVARQIFERSGATLPVDVARIAHEQGLALRAQPLEPSVSGMLVIKEGQAIIGLNEAHHPHRQRFTIAHELGHYLLHRQVASVFIDAVYYRDAAASGGSQAQEIEANAFAAELLMPERVLREQFGQHDLDLVDDALIRQLASRWGVSGQALTIRLTALGLITVE